MSKAPSKPAVGKLGESSLKSVVQTFIAEYEKTPSRLKVLDLFSACALCTALFQFVYAFLVGSFPFNAFLAGLFCCVGTFVLTVSLRMQLSGEEGTSKSPERVYVDYVFSMTVLFLAVWCYIG